MRNPIFKIYFLFLKFSLELVNNLNVQFQAENLKIHVLLEEVKALYTTLIANFIKKKYNIEQDNLNEVEVDNPRAPTYR